MTNKKINTKFVMYSSKLVIYLKAINIKVSFPFKQFFFRNGLFRHGVDFGSKTRIIAAFSAAASADFVDWVGL